MLSGMIYRSGSKLSDPPDNIIRWPCSRGYGAVDVSPKRLDIQYHAISEDTDRDATVATLKMKTFVIEDGRPGASSSGIVGRIRMRHLRLISPSNLFRKHAWHESAALVDAYDAPPPH